MSKLDLSGGSGGKGGERIYTAPNGVVVESSAPVYNSSGNYYMGYLFDGSVTQEDGQPDTYWLTGSSGNRTLTFDFASFGNVNIEELVVFPRTRSDASSNYRIFVSYDGEVFEEVVGWVVNTHNDDTPYGTKRTHQVQRSGISHLRFELTRNGMWGVTLSGIEIHLMSEGKHLIKSKNIIYTLTENNQLEQTDIQYIPTREDFQSKGVENFSALVTPRHSVLYDFEEEKTNIVDEGDSWVESEVVIRPEEYDRKIKRMRIEVLRGWDI